MTTREQYKLGCQLARYLRSEEKRVKLLEKNGEYTRAKTLQLEIWRTYERDCWIMGISYRMAYTTRFHVASADCCDLIGEKYRAKRDVRISVPD